MIIRIYTIFFALCLPLCALAQQVETVQSRPAPGLPEEVVITGDRSLQQLQTKMLDAEKTAYNIFNMFNDEKRFNINCSMHQPTGTHLEKQICQPEFESRATRDHARDYWEYMRAEYDPYGLSYRPAIAFPAQEAMIASQQQAYRKKMQQVAQEHPEFVDALISYSEMREQYEAATSTGKASRGSNE